MRPAARFSLKYLAAGDVDGSCEILLKKSLEKMGARIKTSELSFQNKDFRSQTPPKSGPVCLLTNPPYGERLAPEDLGTLYYDLGEWLKQKIRGHRALIFTKFGEHIKSIHLKSKQKEVISNGDFDCRLLNFELY